MSFKDLIIDILTVNVSMFSRHQNFNLHYENKKLEEKITEYFNKNFTFLVEEPSNFDVSVKNFSHEYKKPSVIVNFDVDTIVFGDTFDKLYNKIETDMKSLLNVSSVEFRLICKVDLKNYGLRCVYYDLFSKNTCGHKKYGCSQDDILFNLTFLGKTSEKKIFDKSISTEEELLSFVINYSKENFNVDEKFVSFLLNFYKQT
jgi:hypothetical protein